MAYKLGTILPYQKIYTGVSKGKEKKQKKIFISSHVAFQNVLLLLISFFLGRGVIMNELSPFGFAFFANTLSAKRNKVWVILGLIGGWMTTQGTTFVIRGVITLGLMYWVMERWHKIYDKPIVASLVSSLCVFWVGLFFQWILGGYFYDFILLIIETFITFSLFFIYRTAIPLVIGRVRRKVVPNEELICGAILISLTLLGIRDLSIYGYSIKNILGIAVILLFARYLGSGAGATFGIVVGVVTSLHHFVTPAIIGVYAFAGLLAGTFKDLGKVAVTIGFVLGNAVLTFYINGSTEVFIHIEEILMAMVLLLLAPKTVAETILSFQGMLDYRVEREKMYGDRVREATMEQLQEYSKVFEQMGKSFEQTAVCNPLLHEKDLDEVFERVAQDVCSKCSFYSKCWKKDFYNTYQSMFALLDRIDRSSVIKHQDIPEDLFKKCLQPEKVTQVMVYLYEVYKTNQQWKSQVMESKNLVSQQLKGISQVISNLSNDMRTEIIFKKQEEEEILVAFDKKGIPLRDVMVLEDGQGKYKVTLYGDPCKGKNYCDREMREIVSTVLGRKMIMEQHICNGNGLQNKCKVSFKEATRYRVTTGVARASKNSQGQSGDSYSSISLDDGKHMMALSDGMGSGKRAAKESKTTINLLEHFLEAGFNREIALKTINSILMLRSSDEMFSTIDLTIVDQYTGMTEFIKIGAVSTFIKRGEEVERIASNSLPVGILDDVNMDTSKKQLRDGDFIIMVTDGLLDANSTVEDKEKWVQEELKKIKSRNPQRIAQLLLEEATKKSKHHFRDDITILVGKVWKN